MVLALIRNIGTVVIVWATSQSSKIIYKPFLLCWFCIGKQLLIYVYLSRFSTLFGEKMRYIIDYRAFLSSRAQDVNSIVRQVDRILPVSNLRGEVLFDSWMDIFDGRGAPFAHQPRIFSFNGTFCCKQI